MSIIKIIEGSEEYRRELEKYNKGYAAYKQELEDACQRQIKRAEALKKSKLNTYNTV